MFVSLPVTDQIYKQPSCLNTASLTGAGEPAVTLMIVIKEGSTKGAGVARRGGGLTQKNMALLHGVDLFEVQVWVNVVIWKFS